MADRLFALRLFARVARAGSFSRAARELGLSQPSASRIVATLEQEVGTALLVRSTRALTLTEAGQDYLARIEAILAALDEADHAARGTGELRGSVRVALSSSFGVRAVIPTLDAFLRQHPALRVELLMNDQRQALIAEGVDVAFRFGDLPDSSAVARRLGSAERVLVAAPSYLRRAGRPKAPADLAPHAIIVGPAGLGPEGWTFTQRGRQVSVRLEARLTISSNEGAVAAAVAGLGIVASGDIACRDDLERGALVRVLPRWSLGTVDVHAVFPAGRAAKPAARVLAEHVARVFA